jgi:hypothetical protein
MRRLGLANAIDAKSTMSTSNESERSGKIGLDTAANRGVRNDRGVRIHRSSVAASV